MFAARHFVIRMHLNRKVLTGVDEFHEKGKVVAKFGVNALANKLCTVSFYKFGKRATSIISTVGNAF